jgi:3-(methylthio)propanoyl-CoA dehydrogenase
VLRRCTSWLVEHRGEPGDLLAGATPYLRLFATVVGGVLLAKGAAAARRHLDDPGASGFDEQFLTAKVATATFFIEQLLPAVHGLAPAVTAGAEQLAAVGESSLAP